MVAEVFTLLNRELAAFAPVCLVRWINQNVGLCWSSTCSLVLSLSVTDGCWGNKADSMVKGFECTLYFKWYFCLYGWLASVFRGPDMSSGIRSSSVRDIAVRQRCINLGSYKF